MPPAAPIPRIVCNRGPNGNPPGWLFRPSPCDLSYLGWGRRRYGDSPIRPVLHEGWHYFFVLAGSPNLILGGRRIKGRPGMATISHPDCSVGHDDEPGRPCQMLTCIWRSAPRHPDLAPEPGGTLKLMLDERQTARMRRLHAQCRETVARANERSALELQAARIQMDLCLLDAREHLQAPDNHFRIDLAVDFLRNHLADAKPVKLLCDYLQVSGSSLKRIFLEHTGKSPRAFATDLRMDWAREQLASGTASVKEISFSLGYRHANDFTRAFKQHYRRTPRDFLPRKSA